jgi:hypothetical protein
LFSLSAINEENFFDKILIASERQHFKGFLSYPDIINFIPAFIKIHQWNWLDDIDNVDLIKYRVRQYTGVYLDCLRELVELTPSDLPVYLAYNNVTIFFSQDETVNCALEVLGYLMEFKILSQAYQNMLSELSNFENLNALIRGLYEQDILVEESAQQVFDIVLQNHDILLYSEEMTEAWSLLHHTKIINNEKWQNIMHICTQNNHQHFKLQRLVQYFVQIGFLKKSIDLQINIEESTHQSSIHESASETAKRLYIHYSQFLNDSIYSRIKNWLGSCHRAHHPYITSIQRAFINIYKENYLDEVSRVTTKTLFELIWIAIHDESRRISSLDDCKKRLLCALYDISRGKNFNDKFEDMGGEDQSICLPGIFNKLIESMVSLHPDFQLTVITQELLSLKLPRVTIHTLNNYLSVLIQSKSLSDFHMGLSLIFTIEPEGLVIIWPFIKEKVADELFSEFETLFSHRQEEKFYQIINNGEYTNCSELNLQNELASSRHFIRHQTHLLFRNHRLMNEYLPTETKMVIYQPR